MLDVLIALGDPIAGIGLEAIVRDAPDLRCVGRLGEGEDVRGAARSARPDVVILDVAFRRSDPRLIPDISDDLPDTSVLVYVHHAAEECALRQLLARGSRVTLSPEAAARLDDCCLTSLRGRARGCVAAGYTPEMIVTAIRSVAEGHIAAAPWLSVLAASLGAGQGGGRKERAISPRELDVLVLLAEGLSNKQIARRLGIKEQTVKNHLTRLMQKLGVDNRLEAGLLAQRYHLTLTDARTEATAEAGG